jgi:cytochrome c-type biogenesis protein CcmH
MMLFWVLCAVLTAAALYVVTRPLSASAISSALAEQEAQSELSVYRQQLQEIESDRARGVLLDSEADSARVEIQRRMLARAEEAAAEGAGEVCTRKGSARVAFAGAAICVPLLSLALYLSFGSPGLPSQPHAQRSAIPIENATIAGLVAQVEARLQAHPEDGRGWDVIAPVYLRQGRFIDAARAYQRAIRLLGESPARLAGLGEAAVFANNGIVTEEARRAFERLIALEPKRPEARFWLALAKEQDGDLKTALTEYRTLLAEAPIDAPWRAAVEERIAAVASRVTAEGRASAPGPTAEDAAAAEKLSPAERAAMIDQMVERLANRLQENGRDLAGWQRLLRAYAVLGQREKAAVALAQARKAFAGDSASLATLEELARSLGLDS